MDYIIESQEMGKINGTNCYHDAGINNKDVSVIFRELKI